MKCTQSEDYEIAGCDNCKQSQVVCDLIVQRPQTEQTSPQHKRRKATHRRDLAPSPVLPPTEQLPMQAVQQPPHVSLFSSFDPQPAQYAALRPSIPVLIPLFHGLYPYQLAPIMHPVAYQPTDGAPGAPPPQSSYRPMYAPLEGHFEDRPPRPAPLPQQQPPQTHPLPAGKGSLLAPMLTTASTQQKTPMHDSNDTQSSAKTSQPPSAVALQSPLTESLLKEHFNFNANMTPDSDSLHIQNAALIQFLLGIDAFRLGIGPKPTRELIDLYFFKINSIFPIVFEPDFRTDFDRGELSSILLYAVVLAIARDKMSERIFIANNVFSRECFDLQLHTFCDNLMLKMRMVLMVVPGSSKLSRLACHLLLALHLEFKHTATEQSSQDLAMAINYAVSMGLHCTTPAPHPSGRTHAGCATPQKVAYIRNLWWICFIFDRFNCVVNKRPLFINSEDFNIDRPTDVHLLELVELASALAPAPRKDASFVDAELARHQSDLTKDHLFEVRSSQTHLPGVSLETYRQNMTYLLVRFCNIMVIVMLQLLMFEAELRTPETTGIDTKSVVAAAAAILYIERLGGLHDVITIPWVPLVLCIALSVFVDHGVRGQARAAPTPPPHVACARFLPRWSDETVRFFAEFSARGLRQLEELGRKWLCVWDALRRCRQLQDATVPRRHDSPGTDKLRIRSLLANDTTCPIYATTPSLVGLRDPQDLQPHKYLKDYVLPTPDFVTAAHFNTGATVPFSPIYRAEGAEGAAHTMQRHLLSAELASGSKDAS